MGCFSSSESFLVLTILQRVTSASLILGRRPGSAYMPYIGLSNRGLNHVFSSRPGVLQKLRILSSQSDPRGHVPSVRSQCRHRRNTMDSKELPETFQGPESPRSDFAKETHLIYLNRHTTTQMRSVEGNGVRLNVVYCLVVN
jgi:hypothetical protein